MGSVSLGLPARPLGYQLQRQAREGPQHGPCLHLGHSVLQVADGHHQHHVSELVCDALQETLRAAVEEQPDLEAALVRAECAGAGWCRLVWAASVVLPVMAEQLDVDNARVHAPCCSMCLGWSEAAVDGGSDGTATRNAATCTALALATLASNQSCPPMLQRVTIQRLDDTVFARHNQVRPGLHSRLLPAVACLGIPTC